MPYQNLGYDEFLNLQQPSSQPGDFPQSLDPQAFDYFTDQISGSKVQGGAILSPDGKFKIDLDKGTISLNNGLANVLQIGNLDNGETGLLLRDGQGNIIMQYTDFVKLLQTSDKAFSINLQTGLVKLGGNVSSDIFKSSDIRNGGANQQILAGDHIITGSHIPITLDRTASLLVLAQINFYLAEPVGNTCNGFVYIAVDGKEVFGTRMILGSGNDSVQPGHGYTFQRNMAPGDHSFDLIGHTDILSGSTARMVIYSFAFTYIEQFI